MFYSICCIFRNKISFSVVLHFAAVSEKQHYSFLKLVHIQVTKCIVNLGYETIGSVIVLFVLICKRFLKSCVVQDSLPLCIYIYKDVHCKKHECENIFLQVGFCSIKFDLLYFNIWILIGKQTTLLIHLMLSFREYFVQKSCWNFNIYLKTVLVHYN